MEFIIKHFDDIYINILISQYEDTKFFKIWQTVEKLQIKDKYVDGNLLLKMMGKKIIKQIIKIHSKDILLEALRTIAGDKYIEPHSESKFYN